MDTLHDSNILYYHHDRRRNWQRFSAVYVPQVSSTQVNFFSLL